MQSISDKKSPPVDFTEQELNLFSTDFPSFNFGDDDDHLLHKDEQQFQFDILGSDSSYYSDTNQQAELWDEQDAASPSDLYKLENTVATAEQHDQQIEPSSVEKSADILSSSAIF